MANSLLLPLPLDYINFVPCLSQVQPSPETKKLISTSLRIALISLSVFALIQYFTPVQLIGKEILKYSLADLTQKTQIISCIKQIGAVACYVLFLGITFSQIKTISKGLLFSAIYKENSFISPRLLSLLFGVNVSDSNNNTLLHFAVKQNDHPLVSQLLKHGANITLKNKEGESPWDLVTKLEDSTLLHLFARKSVKTFPDMVRLAVERGDLELVRELMRRDVFAGRKNEAGLTPLDLAVNQENLEIIHALIIRKRNIYIDITNDQYPSLLFFAVQKNDFRLVSAILERRTIHNNQVNAEGNTVLHLAASNPEALEIFSLLMKKGANTDATNHRGETPLHIAAKYNNLAATLKLLPSNPDNVNAIDIEGNTPLHSAASKGSLQVFDLLVFRNNVNINAINERRQSLLHLIVDRDGDDTTDLILIVNTWGFPHIDSRDLDGNTPYTIAIRGDKLEKLKTLLKKAPTLLGTRDLNQNTGLHIAAESGSIKTLRHLLEKIKQEKRAAPKREELFRYNAPKAPTPPSLVDAVNAQKNTPLHLASEQGHVLAVQALLGHGAKPNLLNENGETPLAVARKHNHPQIIRILSGDQNGAPSHVLPIHELNSMTEELQSSADRRTENRIPPQHRAAQLNESFSGDGLNLDVLDEEGNTLLHTAAKHNAASSIESLLKISDKINSQNRSGDTPLHLAVKFNNLPAVRALLKGNPDLNIRNVKGNTPLEIASQYNHKYLITRLFRSLRAS